MKHNLWAATAAAILWAGSALAQPGGPESPPGDGPGRGPAGAQAMAMAGPPGPGHHGDPCADLAPRTEARLAFLKAKLALTADQGKAFSSFAAAMKSADQKLLAACDARPKTPPASFPARFDDRLRMHSARLEADKIMAAANHALYDSLTADQKAVLDAPPPGHPGMGPGGMGPKGPQPG